jgi:hypothetical protein
MIADLTSERLARAAHACDAAFEEFDLLHDGVMLLMRARANREWSAEDFNTYLELAHRERLALRRYRAARGWFDNERRRANRIQAARARAERPPGDPPPLRLPNRQFRTTL